MPSASSSCPQRQQLLEELEAAIRELTGVHQDEMKAAMNHDFVTFDSLEQRLIDARTRRDDAAERLKRHLHQHRCS